MVFITIIDIGVQGLEVIYLRKNATTDVMSELSITPSGAKEQNIKSKTKSSVR